MKFLGLSPLGRRLAAAFVVVAVVTLALFAALTLLADRRDVDSLARSSRSDTLAAVATAAAGAYRAADGWSGADLQPVIALAASADAAVEIDSSSGQIILRSGDPTLLASRGGVHQQAPVAPGSGTVGEVRMAFPSGGLSPAQRRLRSAVIRTASLAAGLAVVLALVMSVLITRLVVRPLRRLSAAASSIGAGRRGVRIGPGTGLGELSDLSAAFDSMAASLERAEELRQAMVADVAHELRTPIAVLQAETEALVDGVREASLEALSSLHDETLRLGRMVEDLQALASADAAGLSLECQPVDLAPVVAQATQTLAERFRAAEVTVGLSLTAVTVWADPRRLDQVVTNLLTNACKFTPPGGRVDVTVSAEDGFARLEVADTGPGIAPGEREQVFDRFYRGGAGRRAGGTGIGLAVVKQLVEAHGGNVQVGDAPPGGGTSFVVLLPGHYSFAGDGSAAAE